MQTVTDKYIAAMRSGSRTDRITGTITLTDGTVIDVTDNVLVNNNLSVDEQIMCSFDIGTFYSSQMKLAIYDSEALLHEFANARVELRYGLLVGEEYEEVFLGRYTVDGTNCKRVRDRVYLTAYDRSAKFDRIKCGQIVNTAMPPYNALQLICSECSVTLATAQEEIEAMPNGTLSIKCDSSRIETMRDCVMWIAALLGGYARINREGMLEIRKAKYSVDPNDQTTIIVDRVLNSKERISTTFSDTRIYPKYMEAYCGGESKVYTSSYVSTDTQARAGSFSLPENPLVISLSAEKQDEINGNILDYLDGFKQRNIKAAIFGDPAIECGDTIKCTGGSIDVGRNIVGVVTRYTWKFRQQSTIQCVAPAAGEITAESDVSTFSVEAVSEEAADGAFVMPRAQSEKKSAVSTVSDVEKFTSFSANADGTYTYNGVTYGFETDTETGFINRIFDDEKNVEINAENADVNTGIIDFNTVVMALAMSNKIGGSISKTVFIYDFGNEHPVLTGGWYNCATSVGSSSQDIVSFTKNSDNVVLTSQVLVYNLNHNTFIGLGSVKKVDLTDFAKLKVVFDFYAESSKSDASSSCGLSVLNDYTITQWNYVNRVLGEGTSGKDIDVTDEVIEVDISSLTGEYYICVNAGGNSQIRKSKVTVKQIYLERW